MAFGKAIAAEPLDLLEAALGEVAAYIRARPCRSTIFVTEIVDRADIAERRHRAAQAIGFLGREARRDDRQLHRLLLKERHADRSCPRPHCNSSGGMRWSRRGKIDRLFAVAPAQIGMHHVALDRPGPDDRHLDRPDHRISAGLQARQHVDLRAAFDLEHADAVALAQHVVDRRILWHRCRVPASGRQAHGRASGRSFCGCRSACRAPAHRPSSARARRYRPCPIR